MSFLFCSWATNDESKKDVEAEEEDDELKESKNYFLEKSMDTIEKAGEKEKTNSKTPVKNGDLSKEELIKDEPVQSEKKPFFVMWNTQQEEEEVEEEDDKIDYPEENEKDQTTEKSKPSESEPVSPVKKNVSHSKEDVKEVKSITDAEDKPMFFAVWKDPNKEDEYISSSSSSEEDELEEDLTTKPATAENGNQEDKNETSVVNGKDNDQDESDDIFNKIASSVSKSMTTIFCDNEDFEIKQSFSDDNDFDNTDLGFEVNVKDVPDVGSLSSGKRSRSGSFMSFKSLTDSDREGVRKSTREKRPKKKFDLSFSKPKPISRFFEPGSFIDKSLYKTHRCDVKIKKFKIPGRDLENLLPPSKKRKTDEDEMPLSKRKKLTKTETRKPFKPRSTNSITKREVSGKYHSVCKYVSKQCPLCWNFWNVSQPYGLHVYNQTCQKGDCSSTIDPAIDINEKAFLSVHTSNNQTDSYVSTSNIPSLKLLCRKNLHGKNSTSDVAISVKEGLEYYHSLVMPGNVNEHVLFRKLSQMAKITIVSSVRQYERLCRDPLKVAIYLEKKISRARGKHGAMHLSTYKWVDKYNYFLRLPLHDLYLNISKDDGFRVLEVPDSGAIKLLCLVCSSMSCSGCLPIKEKPKKAPSDPSKQLKKNKKHRKKKSVDKKAASKSQSIPHLKLVKCKSCGKYLKNLAALKSHAKVCKPGSKNQKKHKTS